MATHWHYASRAWSVFLSDWSINKSNCFRLDSNNSIKQDTHVFDLFGINLASFKFDADVGYGTTRLTEGVPLAGRLTPVILAS